MEGMLTPGHQPKRRVVLFLGSGFSAASGLPTTSSLSEELLQDPPRDSPTRKELESFISQTIRQFWKTVFGWRPGARPPSLEDHFTQIDLAANSGHYLGPSYDPKRLRAIRRMTIHRILSRLRSGHPPVDIIVEVFGKLKYAFDITFVTTNWDAEAERHLQEVAVEVDDGLDARNALEFDGPPSEDRVRVLKLHGCINRAYCDCCRTLIPIKGITEAVPSLDFLLRDEDFKLFDEKVAQRLAESHRILKRCDFCGAELAVRIGTFSYRKDLSPSPFYSVWDKAQAHLQEAEKWLFVGYSLPDADIEIRHLLKFTQLARRNSSTISIDVVLREDCDAGRRYQRFFGLSSDQVFQDGIEEWAAKRSDAYCR
jgi:NAD-dependent SIR2 family protein deacetylase